MSLIFTDGFDHHNSLALKWSSGNATVGSTIVRTGTGSMHLQNTNETRQVAVADEHATFILGFGAYRNGSTCDIAFKSDNTATTHITVRLDTDGSIKAYRGTTGGTLIGTAPNAIPSATWVHVGIKVTLHDTTGVLKIWVNGGVVLDLTSQDTKNGGTKTVFDSFSFTGGNAHEVDDLYVCNGAGATQNDFLGDCKIETLYPNGNGNSSQLTGSDGNSTDNYLLVDETPPNTTDYNGSTTNDQVDTYTMTNLVTTVADVLGVNLWAYNAKSDVGTKGGAIVVRSGGTDYEQTSVALGTGYVYQNKILVTDPATSAAWTVSGVNGMEAGFKTKAS